MKKSEMMELLKYVGDLDSYAGTKSYAFNDGKAKGVRAIDLKNGKGIEMTLLADKGLDISHLTYKGMNVGAVGKNGIVAPEYHVEDDVYGFLKSFNIGFLTTCGMTYAGAPSEVDGRKYGLHGVVGNTPAEKVSRELVFDGDEAVIVIKGEIKESRVFAENLALKREVRVHTESNTIHMRDTVVNYGYEKQHVMNVYHFNFGYPLVDDGAKIYLSAKNMKPRDDVAKRGIDRYNIMDKAQVGYDEQCFFYTDDEPNKDSFAMLVHKDQSVAMILHYNQEQCPMFCEWKCMRAGDYALGLEPTTRGVLGYANALKEGKLRYVDPFGEYVYDFTIELTEDRKLIEEYISKSNS